MSDSEDQQCIHRLESSRELRGRAREFRRAPTQAEERLWQALRDRRFRGLKFRRQRPLGPFVADFLCVELGLVVEVDGTIHDQADVRGRDALRDEWMGNRRLTVLRLSSALVMGDLTAALRTIGDVVDRIRVRGVDGTGRTALTPAPLPPNGRGEPDRHDGAYVSPHGGVVQDVR